MLSFFNHPITLAVFAVAAVGFLVYDVLNSNNERQQRQRYDYGRGWGPHNPPPPPPDPPYDRLPPPNPPYHRRPPPPSPPAPAIRSPVRRRKSKERSQTRSDSPDDPPSDPGSNKTVTSDSANENFKSPQFDDCKSNLNCPKSDEEKIFEKDVFSETTDDCTTRNPNNKVRHRKRSVRKNATTEKSRKGSYPSKKLNVVSLNNIKPSHLQGDQQSEQSDDSGKIISTSSTSDNSDRSSTESTLSEREEMYKRNVCENIQNSFASSSQHSGYSSSSAESSMSTVSESDICLACEENRVNTRTDPCNHRYLCFSCAKKVIRMTKRCRVCRRRIEKFHCF